MFANIGCVFNQMIRVCTLYGFIENQAASKNIILLDEPSFARMSDQLSDNDRNWLSAQSFTGKADQMVLLPDESGHLKQVMLGVGEERSIDRLAAIASTLPDKIFVVDNSAGLYSDRALYDLYLRWGMAHYRFDRYTTKPEAKAQLIVDKSVDINLLTNQLASIYLVRDMVNTPCEDMPPAQIVEEVKKVATEFSADISVISGDDLLTKGYPCVHAVGRAAANDRQPHLIDMRWGDTAAPKVTLVGKGVCFDTGGLNLKPGGGMKLMKKDMGGAACALGLARMIMSNTLPVRLRLLIPTVENSVGGSSYRPGDVLNTRAGLTVEVTNTDAEGRLILCDALTEAGEESPDYLFDFATLTGAARVALGPTVSALFSNDDELAGQLQSISEKVNDPMWQLPLFSPYNDYLKSDIADCVNASLNGFAGAITAGLYLQQFVSDDVKWAHFDISAWNYTNGSGKSIGAEARAIHTAFEYLKQQFPQ